MLRRIFRQMRRTPPELSDGAYKRIQAVTLQTTPPPPRRVTYHTWRVWHHRRYGGSPIPIRLKPDDFFSHDHLYLGPSYSELGDIERPDVDAIVNLCEVDDAWPLCEYDRRWERGEGYFGYTWAMLNEDALGVVDLLRGGQRVLIHCMAGVNRSVTLTCATLMHVEGIDAATALARIYRFHPMAHPEDRHWLALRQLDIAIHDATATNG